MENFHKRLKNAREMREISQMDFAKRAGIHPAQISFYETGLRKPSMMNLLKMASLLNVSCDWLMGRTGNIAAHNLPLEEIPEDRFSEKDVVLMEVIKNHLLARRKTT